MPEYVGGADAISAGIRNAFEMLFGEEMSIGHSRRLEGYRRNWLFYLGHHWSYARDPGETALTINYCKKTIDSHVNFAFKKGFSITIKDDPETPENEAKSRDFIRLKLEDVWEKNNKKLWILEAGQGGAVTGDVFARVSWDKTNIYDEPYARVDLMPSHLCFPEFGGPHGVDRKILRRLLIVVPAFRKKEKNTITPGRFFREQDEDTDVELLIKSELWSAPEYDSDGNLLVPAMVRYYEDEKLIKEEQNPLGEIPVVHIPNLPIAGEYYGASDLESISSLNQEINEKATDISEVIEYHGSPQTVVSGAKLTSLEKGTNRIWGIPGDAKIYNLELSGDLSAANSHLEFLKNAFRELSSSPEHFWGKTQPMSNTTGVAYQMSYFPVLEKRDSKVLTFGHGIERINRLILKMTEIAVPEFAIKMQSVKGNKYRNTVTFPDPLPQDEVRSLEKKKLRLSMGLTSRKRILMEEGYTSTEADEIISEVDEERMKLAELDYAAVGGGSGDTSPYGEGIGSGNGNILRGGSDDTRGEKIDSTLQSK
jgi:hypothetical protein